MTTRELFEFDNGRGERLAARLDLPPKKSALGAWAVLAHCFTCSKDLKSTRHLASALTASGLGVLSFDFTGLGQSQGEFKRTTFSTNVQDLERALEEMTLRGMAPGLLIGHSLGGAAALFVASRSATLQAVATIAAPYEPAHVAKTFASHHETIRCQGEASVKLAGRPFTIREEFLEDLERFKPERYLPEIKAALLVLHSPDDETVRIDNASRIFAESRHPKSFISLDGADHLLTSEREARYVGGVIASWSSRYL